MGKRGPKPGTNLKYPLELRKTLVDEICDITATSSLSLVTILKANKQFPSYTDFYKWIQNDNKLAEKYARAKEQQSDYLADEMLDIVDNAKDYNKARLQIDTRKWLASKLKAKKYGDKIQADVDTSLTVKLVQFGGKKE